MSEARNRVFIYGIILSSALSLVLAGNFAFWSVSSNAFDSGYEAAERELKGAAADERNPFCCHGESTYRLLSRTYSYLALSALGILLLNVLHGLTHIKSHRRTFTIASILLLLFVWWNLGWMAIWKDPEWNEVFYVDFNAMLRETVPFDKLSRIVVMLMLGTQTVLLASSFRRKAV